MKLGKAFRNIAVLGALAALLGGFPAQAAEYPTKEIRIIQPYPSGGFNDVVTRKMAEVIAQDQLLSKDILAVAITGANTRNALQTVLDAAPDGYTLLIHHTALVATKVSGQLPIGYTDFEMLGGLCAGPIAIDVMKDSPWKNVQEMIVDVKAHPGKYTMALPGTGGTAHIATLHFLKLAGIPVNAFRYLPLSGGAETMKALLGKKVDIRCATAADSMRACLGGDVRALVVLTHLSLPAFKGVPTLKDMGLPDSLHIRMGLFAPKGTPQDVKDKWTAILKTVTEDEGFKAFMDERGSPAQFSTPAEWAKIYESDTRLVTDILNAQQ